MKQTFILPLIAALLASPVIAQTPATPAGDPATAVPKVLLTPAQTAHILKELEKAEADIGKGRGGVFGGALTKFREAMGSELAAVALYLDCYKLEHFERRNLKQTDFMDWRDRNEAKMKEDDFRQALLLQLEFLVLTIQAQDIQDQKKMGPLVAALQAYLGKAITAVQASTKHTASGAVEAKDTGPKGPGGARKGGGGGGGGGLGGELTGILRQAVSGSEFANAFLLDDYLTRKDWEYRPLDVAGIYGKVIFPYYLAEKTAELPGQWDARVNAELALRKAMLSETEFNLYTKDELPRLQWEKSNYLVANNVNPVNALADMLNVIKNNPNHPDAAGWLKEFRELVKAVSDPGVPAPPEKPIGTQ